MKLIEYKPSKTLRIFLTPLSKYFYEIHLCRLLKITFDLFLQYTGTIKAGSRHCSPLYTIATEKIQFFLSEFGVRVPIFLKFLASFGTLSKIDDENTAKKKTLFFEGFLILYKFSKLFHGKSANLLSPFFCKNNLDGKFS